MKDFVKSLGGAGWAAFGGLSVIVTVVVAIGLPYFVDTSNPLVLLMAGTVLFIVAFANGWKQRGFRNERDIRLADELEKERIDEKKKLDADIAKINADKELELERMRQERADKMKADARKQAEAEANKARKALYEKIFNLPAAQMSLIQEVLDNGGVYETSRKDTVAFALKSDGLLSELPITDALRAHWKLSESANDILSNDNSMQQLVADSAYRFKQEALRDEFERLSYISKLFIYLLYLSDHVDTCWKVYSETHAKNFMYYIVVGEDKRRYKLKEAAREILDDNPTLLEFCDPDGEKKDWLEDRIAANTLAS